MVGSHDQLDGAALASLINWSCTELARLTKSHEARDRRDHAERDDQNYFFLF